MDGRMTDVEMDELVETVIAAMRPVVRNAVERALAVGSHRMRDNILKAAGAPIVAYQHTGETVQAGPENDDDDEPDDRRRAPRGLLQTLLAKVLGENPGLVLSDVETKVLALDDRLARRSIYGELRRKEGELYHRQGSAWYLGPGKVEAT